MVFVFNFYGDPDQTPRSAASDLGMHCLPMSQNRTLGIYGLITTAPLNHTLIMLFCDK